MNEDSRPSNAALECPPKPEPDGRPPPAKRQRVSQACSTCRDRKTRCDGRQPICLACEQKCIASTCKFDQVRRPRTRPDPSTTPLKQHLGSEAYPIEPTARDDAAQVLSGLARWQQPASTEAMRSLPPTSSPVMGRSLTFREERKPDSRVRCAWGVATSDGLATVAADNDSSMYGPSSTVAFLRHVMPPRSQPGSVPQERSNESNARPSTSEPSPERLPARTGGIAMLPRRCMADNIVFCFWEFVFPLFPVLHRSTFIHRYENLWVEERSARMNCGSETDDAIFTATLNLVFAIGCKFSSLVEPSQKATVADEFYQRARQSYPFEILDTSSVSLVQMLLLTGVYLQSTDKASRCWNSVGLAIRMAQSLGLHVDHGHRKGVTAMELQMRRRIWHTCINLDRLLSMTFGRPVMIHRTIDVPIPDLVDDVYLERALGTAVQPAAVPSRLGLFISSCKLFEILEEVLRLFNCDDSGVNPEKQGFGTKQLSHLLPPVLESNRRLDEFWRNIPDYLRAQAPGTSAPLPEEHIHLQRRVLYCRFLYVRIISLRPLLLMAIKGSHKPPTCPTLDDEVMRRCCHRCALTACHLIDNLYDHLGSAYRTSGWHTVYFAFTSAMVLLAYSRIGEQHLEISAADIESSWAKSFAIFHHYETQVQSASQAGRILHAMRSAKTRTHDSSRSRATCDGPPVPVTSSSQPMEGDSSSTPDADLLTLLDPDNINFPETWFEQQLNDLDWEGGLDAPQTLTS